MSGKKFKKPFSKATLRLTEIPSKTTKIAMEIKEKYIKFTLKYETPK